MPKKKFSLDPEPTFKTKVGIPVHGVGVADIEFTFKHRTQAAFTELFNGIGENNPNGVDIVMDIAAGWDLDWDFNRDNVERMLSNYMGSLRAIIEKYSAEMMGIREGN